MENYIKTTNNNETKINLYQPVEYIFIQRLSEEMEYLCKYIKDRYKPLVPQFKIQPTNGIYLAIKFKLIGENRFIIENTFLIKRSMKLREPSELIRKYTENLRQEIEHEITKVGIKQ
jgi:hypothetical protein